jgi:hypothetical protein
VAHSRSSSLVLMNPSSIAHQVDSRPSKPTRVNHRADSSRLVRVCHEWNVSVARVEWKISRVSQQIVRCEKVEATSMGYRVGG